MNQSIRERWRANGGFWVVGGWLAIAGFSMIARTRHYSVNEFNYAIGAYEQQLVIAVLLMGVGTSFATAIQLWIGRRRRTPGDDIRFLAWILAFLLSSTSLAGIAYEIVVLGFEMSFRGVVHILSLTIPFVFVTVILFFVVSILLNSGPPNSDG